jgi:hypothetical protein
MPRPVVALLTDFGTDDPFVGTMKGVVLTRCPDATLVDLAHGVSPQRVEEGAFWLERSVGFFPEGTVFVVVVDPGVGSSRRAIAASSGGKVFVAPDNGILSLALACDPAAIVHAIDTDALGLAVRSRTFHGRDVFAPVGAEIAAGRLAVSGVGPRCDALAPLSASRLTRSPGVVEGTVISVDRFGNLITNVTVDDLKALPDARVELGQVRLPISQTYSDVKPGALVALVDAFDVLEIACRDGNASRLLGAERGAPVTVRSTR